MSIVDNGLNVKSNNMGFPTVILNRKDLEYLILDWSNNNYSVNEIMGILLSKLGFDSEYSVYLDVPNPYVSVSEGISFSCFVDVDEKLRNNWIESINIITLVYGDDCFGKLPKIILQNSGVKISYKCIFDDSQYYGVGVDFDKYEINLLNGNVYSRHLGVDAVLIKLRNKDYNFEFYIKKSDSVSNSESLILDNELELFNYLASLTFPVSLLEVYRKVCEISLEDVSIYQDVFMVVEKLDNVLGNKTIELIGLESGELVDLVVNYNGKKVFINVSKGWFYNTDGISIGDNREGGLNYISHEYIEDFDELKKRIDTAYEEAKGVNKLLRTIIGKKDGSRNG